MKTDTNSGRLDFWNRYTITEVEPENSQRVFHVLDESRVDTTHAPQAASRYYRVTAYGAGYQITRDGGETRTATPERCDCPHGGRGAMCIHRLIVWRILGRAARGNVPVAEDPWEGRS